MHKFHEIFGLIFPVVLLAGAYYNDSSIKPSYDLMKRDGTALVERVHPPLVVADSALLAGLSDRFFRDHLAWAD
jgi:hypothetical protein